MLQKEGNMPSKSDNSRYPSYWIKVCGLDVHYKLVGHGPPVIFIHGGGNDWREWRSNIDMFSKSFQVYALDLPGFGLSQLPDVPVSPSWSVAFIKNFVDNLGIAGPSLIGHSLGAMLSFAYAARYPESIHKLVVVDSAGLGEISRIGKLLLAIFNVTDRWQGKKRGPRYIDRPVTEWRVLQELAKIKSPVLIIWGQIDFYLPASQARLAHTLIPGSQLSIFPGCRHAPQRERPDVFNGLVSRFLSDQ
jgi:pimeloyl-ACP methyl ester carboxylesterase